MSERHPQRPTRIRRLGPVIDGWIGALAPIAAQIEAARAEVAASSDPEAIHRLRVALRRTRALLAQAGGAIPDGVRTTHRAALGEVADLTGDLRDLDVLVGRWDELSGVAGPDGEALQALGQRARTQREQTRDGTLAALQSDDVTDAITAWCRWVAGGWAGGHAPDGPLGAHLAGRLARTHRVVKRAGATAVAAPDTADETWHELRKDLKRYTYLLDAFAPILPRADRRTVVRAVRPLQATLGAFQDATVQIAWLRRQFADPAAGTTTALAAGRVIEHLERERSAHRATAVRQFAALDSRRVRRAVRAMRRSLRG